MEPQPGASSVADARVQLAACCTSSRRCPGTSRFGNARNVEDAADRNRYGLAPAAALQIVVDHVQLAVLSETSAEEMGPLEDDDARLILD